MSEYPKLKVKLKGFHGEIEIDVTSIVAQEKGSNGDRYSRTHPHFQEVIKAAITSYEALK